MKARHWYLILSWFVAAGAWTLWNYLMLPVPRLGLFRGAIFALAVGGGIGTTPLQVRSLAACSVRPAFTLIRMWLPDATIGLGGFLAMAAALSSLAGSLLKLRAESFSTIGFMTGTAMLCGGIVSVMVLSVSSSHRRPQPNAATDMPVTPGAAQAFDTAFFPIFGGRKEDVRLLAVPALLFVMYLLFLVLWSVGFHSAIAPILRATVLPSSVATHAAAKKMEILGLMTAVSGVLGGAFGAGVLVVLRPMRARYVGEEGRFHLGRSPVVLVPLATGAVALAIAIACGIGPADVIISIPAKILLALAYFGSGVTGVIWILWAWPFERHSSRVEKT